MEAQLPAMSLYKVLCLLTAKKTGSERRKHVQNQSEKKMWVLICANDADEISN